LRVALLKVLDILDPLDPADVEILFPNNLKRIEILSEILIKFMSNKFVGRLSPSAKAAMRLQEERDRQTASEIRKSDSEAHKRGPQ
jgi:hypothetical protein